MQQVIGKVLILSLLVSCGSGGGSDSISNATLHNTQALTGNSQSTPTTRYDKTFPTSSWDTASPENVGLKQNNVNALINTMTLAEGFILIKDGYILHEQYKNNKFDTHIIASISKSIYTTSFLPLMDEAKISFNSYVRDHIDWFVDIEQGSEYVRTFGDLMSMQSGLIPLRRLTDGEWWNEDPFTLIQETKTIDRDYGHWYYNNGNIVLQTIALQNECNCDVRDNLANINNELGIRSADLTTTEQGNPTVYGGIRMDLPDLARWGLLWANECVWDDHMIASCMPLFESTHEANACYTPNPNYDFNLCEGMSWDYGYSFYLKDGWIFASGLGDKYVLFHPTHDIVAVVFGVAFDTFYTQLDNLLY